MRTEILLLLPLLLVTLAVELQLRNLFVQCGKKS